MRVTVLGAGSWGTTVAALLCRRDHEVLLWARNPEVAAEVDEQRTQRRVPAGRPAARAAAARPRTSSRPPGTPSCWSSACRPAAFRETLEQVRPHLAPWIPVVSLSKGLERGTHLRMTQVIKEVLPGRPAAALTGPEPGEGDHGRPGGGQRDRDGGPHRGRGAAARGAARDVPRLHPPRRHRLRDRRGAQERHRHRHRHGPGPRRGRQHPGRR